MKPVGHIRVPVVDYKGARWGHLSSFSDAHEVVATKAKLAKVRDSFIGNHRVHRVSLKSMVHWRIPVGVQVDISALEPGQAPRRRL